MGIVHCSGCYPVVPFSGIFAAINCFAVSSSFFCNFMQIYLHIPKIICIFALKIGEKQE